MSIKTIVTDSTIQALCDSTVQYLCNLKQGARKKKCYSAAYDVTMQSLNERGYDKMQANLIWCDILDMVKLETLCDDI